MKALLLIAFCAALIGLLTSVIVLFKFILSKNVKSYNWNK